MFTRRVEAHVLVPHTSSKGAVAMIDRISRALDNWWIMGGLIVLLVGLIVLYMYVQKKGQEE
jgi:uncharacterized protein YjeT (DUF2065 family)